MPKRKLRVLNNSPCSIEGCETPWVARKLCRTHYTRFLRHGDASVVLNSSLQTGRHRRIEYLKKRILQDYREGRGVDGLAEDYNISQTAIVRVVHEAGIMRDLSETKLSKLNPMWVGMEVGYAALHDWVRRRKISDGTCENCKESKPLDLANISPRYNKRTYTRNLSNWMYLCRSCHAKQDGRGKRLQEAKWLVKG